MKAQISNRQLAFLIFGGIVLILSPRSFAQTETNLPTVRAFVVDSVVQESATNLSSRGKFSITRSGPTNTQLTVSLAFEGSATAGVDYLALTNTATIEPGFSRTEVTVVPIEDSLAEGPEKVELRLVPNTNYVVFNQTNVAVIIVDNDAPTVTADTQFYAVHEYATNLSATTARFRIKRSGPTTTALSVRLVFEGSATAGVDYQALPDTVTIEPGLSSTTLTVAPIEDSLAEGNETVVLRLLPDANYFLINQPNAVAIIADNDVPTAPGPEIYDGFFHLMIPSTNGFHFRLECSTDLINWSSLWTNTVTDDVIHFVDPEARVFPRRFYRVLPHTGPE